MNTNRPHQQTQGRETRGVRGALATPRQGSLLCPNHRSLGFGRLREAARRFAPLRLLMGLLLVLLAVPAYAQEVEETIRIKTRVVFLDALVKDKKSNVPVSDLKSENFEVL